MLLRSQNKWPASADPAVINVQTFSVPVRNGTLKLPVRAEAFDRLRQMILWWDANVEPVNPGSSWGYNYRMIRGYSTTLSNHASGTAIDINAPLHPLGKRGTVPADKVEAIKAQAHALGLRWGGEYRTRPDEMHFEIDFDPPADVVTYSEQRAAGIAAAAPEAAAYAVETVKQTATATARRARDTLRRNWLIAGFGFAGIAAVYLLFLRPAPRRAAAPALATNPRRRRSRRRR